MRRFKRSLIDYRIIPGCCFQSPGMGTPVIKLHLNLLCRSGNGALFGEMETAHLFFHHSRSIAVLISQHHIQFRFFTDVLCRYAFIHVDHALILPSGRITNGEQFVFRIAGWNFLSVHRKIFDLETHFFITPEEFVLQAFTGHQCPGLHRNILESKHGFLICIGYGAFPHLIQFFRIHIAEFTGYRSGP